VTLIPLQEIDTSMRVPALHVRIRVPFAALLAAAALTAPLAPARAQQQPTEPVPPDEDSGQPTGVPPEEPAPADPEVPPRSRPIKPPFIRPPLPGQKRGAPQNGRLQRTEDPEQVQPGPQPQTPTPTPGARTPPRMTEPPATTPVDKKEAGRNARTVVMNFDKRDLVEVIQFVANFTQRNFILPERVNGKITILSNSPIPADEVWNVFIAALDANNWAVYPVGRYWKLSEKKQSARANIPTYLEPGQETPASEQMVTKLFKLRFVEADQMRNTLNQFTSRDSDFQIFPPDTLIVSDLGLNMRRLEKLVDALDQPGGSEEIHIVQVQFAGAQALAQKLTEIFAAQQGSKAGGQRQLGVAEPVQPPGVPQIGMPQLPQQGNLQGGGPVTVSKIIAEERTNKLIVITSARSFQRVAELIKQLDVPAGGGGVNVYYLSNAKAEDMAATLQALAQGAAATKRPGGSGGPVGAPPGIPQGGAAQVGGGAVSADLFSGEVKVTADKNTNSLVIIASASDYRNMVKVIERLDVQRRQVFVEAVIMEVNLQSENDIGVSAHAGTIIDNLNFRGAQGSAPLVIGSELGGLSSLGGVSALGTLGGFLAGLQGPPITVPGGLTLPSFAVLLNALQSSSDVNVISTPHVLMTDNTEGEVTVGQNVPFQAGFNPTTSALGTAATGTTGTAGLGALGLGGLGSLYAPIQRQNVELRLRIKPQINEGEYVRLEVDEQTEEIASIDKQLGPTTSKRTAKTTVVAKDQETVVLGGLIQERTLKSVQKIPVLGSIPVLGYLFRSEQTKKTKTNLLLFLTPYIIRDPSDYRRIFERKMAERAEFVKRFSGEDTTYEAAIDYTKKPGPLMRVRRAIDFEMSRPENGGMGTVGERTIEPSPRHGPGAPAIRPNAQPSSNVAAPAPGPAQNPLPAEQPARQPGERQPSLRPSDATPASEPATVPGQRPPDAVNPTGSSMDGGTASPQEPPMDGGSASPPPQR
jgi:general secretion pathway protein D